MANRTIHYERAFEHYLRSLRVRLIPVLESRRSFAEGVPIKSLDFLAVAGNGRRLLIDVKGRKCARGGRENWSTEDDLFGLARWQEAFGAESTALLVFLYLLASESKKIEFQDSFSLADRHYGCLAIAIDDYRRYTRVRSPRWKTVSVPRLVFDHHARPISHWLCLDGPKAQVYRSKQEFMHETDK